MAYPSVTYTFANSSTADATAVNQSFTDLINGMSDGTKDFNINALTCAGTATFNGNVALGNAAGDDLTIAASLASSIAIKTTNTYDIGSSTKGLAGIYFGTADTDTARIVSAALAASRTYTLPDAGAAADFVMTAGTQTVAGAKTFSTQLIGKGTATNDSAATGYIGEYLEAVNTASDTNFPTSGQYGGDHTIQLTAGDWDLTLVVYVTAAGSISVLPDCNIGTVTGNDSTGRALGSNYAKVSDATQATWTMMIPSWRQSIAGTTNYYVKVRATYTSGPPTYRYRLSARRVR